MLSLSATASILEGRSFGRAPHDGEYTSVGTDSRAVMPGMLFVAIEGEHFDGHAFVKDAIAQGAVGALVKHEFAAAHPELPLVAVADPRRALGLLAAHWRGRFHIPLIGVTGSNGKTTVKEMCAAILRADFGQNAVLSTAGNLNNDIGLPLTLLKLRHTHRAAVIEMGMNHAGEIDVLTRIARPTVALINNAQRAHLEGLGSVEAIARAKAEIFSGLGEEGIAVINADDPFAAYWDGMNAGRRRLTFGFDARADVQGAWRALGFGGELSITSAQGDAIFTLQVPGMHNARNALAAAAACLAAGVPLPPVVRGLENYEGVRGRLQARPGLKGAQIIDDSYNANPDSMRAAIGVLAALPGRRFFVMGDMGEVGEAAAQLHSEIGGHAKSMGIDRFFTLGEKSAAAAHNFGSGATHFGSVEALVKAIKPLMDESTVVLVKGSRFMRMERVVEGIVEPPPAGPIQDKEGD